MKIEYRKNLGNIKRDGRHERISDCWHWMPKCSHYPIDPQFYVVSKAKNKPGELCDECRAKDRREKLASKKAANK